MKKLILSLLLFGSIFSLFAQTDSLQTKTNVLKENDIILRLAEPDKSNNAMIRIYQDARLASLVSVRHIADIQSQKGFRVQLYSSNVPQKARKTAFGIEKKVLARFPEFDIYVTYSAPFWKVRVGNCATYEDATDLRSFMATEFPELQSEMYIVPDQITVK